jgi:protein-S-isoprenylcysteine O-methyltransferase Ste14
VNARKSEYPGAVYWILFISLWILAIATAIAVFANSSHIEFWKIALYAILLGGYLIAEKKVHQVQRQDGRRTRAPLRYLLSFTWWALILGSVLEASVRPSSQWLVTGVGAILTIAGSALRIWGVHTLGQYYSGHIEVWTGQNVIQSGPYRILRHPGYAGNILQVIGLPLVVNAYFALALSAAVTGLFIFRLLWEEDWLTKNLAGYTEYKKDTWRLIPWIW